MPDAGVVVAQRDPGLVPAASKRHSTHPVGDAGRHREVGAAVARGRAERERRARPRPGVDGIVGLAAGHRPAPCWLAAVRTHVAEGVNVAVAAPDGIGDDAGPAGLVRGAEAGAVVAMEVLVEHQVVLPRRVVLEPVDPAEAGPPAVGVDQEDGDQALAQVLGDVAERQLLSRPGRVLDLRTSSPKNRW